MDTQDAGIDILTHRATRAWLTLHPARNPPRRIALLAEHPKSSVFRLESADHENSDVIAKRCKLDTGSLERTIYEEILPNVPISALQYYGSLAEPDGEHIWLFLEDAGEIQYSLADTKHQSLAAQWLGLLHTSAERLAAGVSLPDRGPDHYLAVLRAARGNILANLANPALRSDDLALLDMIVKQCTLIELHWEDVERFCEGIPKTLVHGDFVGKNVRVQHRQAGDVLLALDWETAGYGIPAPDLEYLDTTAYHSVISGFWPFLDVEKTRRMAELGRILRLLHLVFWASVGLSHPWAQKTTRNYMSIYKYWLDESLRATDWWSER
jgi:hypothetical protein